MKRAPLILGLIVACIIASVALATTPGVPGLGVGETSTEPFGHYELSDEWADPEDPLDVGWWDEDWFCSYCWPPRISFEYGYPPTQETTPMEDADGNQWYEFWASDSTGPRRMAIIFYGLPPGMTYEIFYADWDEEEEDWVFTPIEVAETDQEAGGTSSAGSHSGVSGHEGQ